MQIAGLEWLVFDAHRQAALQQDNLYSARLQALPRDDERSASRGRTLKIE